MDKNLSKFSKDFISETKEIGKLLAPRLAFLFLITAAPAGLAALTVNYVIEPFAKGVRLKDKVDCPPATQPKSAPAP